MSRSDQYVGLHPRAIEWLEHNAQKNEVVITTYKKNLTTGKEDTQTFNTVEHVSHQYSHIKGAYGDYVVALLLEYALIDGTLVREYIQEEQWSSGPMYFIALKIGDEPIKETMWTQEEINEQV